ncbi:NAD(P)-dependent oxidoreductase [Silvibacterium acidisoli]|uniref:NAD(P)-dependent oxidoreductase n=1 Tax=Acidobacteriaceae bacterium ZG23-2 TaxID=2883246 RepID=UPI00406D3570
MRERIGWIGLGRLGAPMAANLLESGYEVVVYNRSREKAEPLVQNGAQIAESPAGTVEKGGIVVSVLWDSDATESIVTPEFLKRMEGGIHICMCTGSPEAARRLTKLHAEHGSAYIEAPVFGRAEAAAARQLAIPYAGSQAAKERVKPVLTALGGQTLFDTGEAMGIPTVIKQFGNFLIISAGRSLEEGLAVVEKEGADPFAAMEFLTQTLFPAPIYRNYGRMLAEKKGSLRSSPIPAKDLGLFNERAQEHDLPNPITRMLLQLSSQ